MSQSIHRRPGRNGAVAMEFAFVLPIFLLTLVGILEFGRAVMVQQIITNAAREGARRAIIPGATTADIESAVNSYLDGTTIDSTNRTVELRDESNNPLDLAVATTHQPLRMYVSVPFSDVSWGLGMWLSNKTFESQVDMRKE